MSHSKSQLDGAHTGDANKRKHSTTISATERSIIHQDIVWLPSPIKASIGSWQREGANATLTKSSVFRVIRSGDEMEDELWCKKN